MRLKHGAEGGLARADQNLIDDKFVTDRLRFVALLVLPVAGQERQQLRADFEAEGRALIDFFIEVVKEEVDDQVIRDRIARAVIDRMPVEDEEAS